MHARGLRPIRPEPRLATTGDEQQSGQGGLIVKAKSICVMALCVASLGASSAMLSCHDESPQASEAAAKDKAAAQKAAADRAAAEKAAFDKAAAEKAAAAKATGDQTAAEKAAADKVAADKAGADKAAADKAAADKAAELAKAEAAALPPDLLEMKAEVAQMTAQLDLTMAKLDTLCASSGDLEKPSKDALESIDALQAESELLKTRGGQMRDRGAAYFETWEKQLASMSTPEVAEIATKRKDELAAQYAQVLTAMQETGSAMETYWGDMKKIRAALDEELTPETHKALAGQVKAAKDKAATLKSRIETTFTKLTQVSLIYLKR
jgi:hypothetical protein